MQDGCAAERLNLHWAMKLFMPSLVPAAKTNHRKYTFHQKVRLQSELDHRPKPAEVASVAKREQKLVSGFCSSTIDKNAES
jgi:hypothetical protein